MEGVGGGVVGGGVVGRGGYDGRQVWRGYREEKLGGCVYRLWEETHAALNKGREGRRGRGAARAVKVSHLST